MNRITNIVATGLAATLISGAPITTPTSLNVKPEASKIEWFVEKVTGQHNGIVSMQSGTIEIEGEKIIGGDFVIDMSSISTTDLEGESKKKLDGHLKSEDFFNTDEFKTATFQINKAETLKNDKVFDHTISGDLTIKGITHPVSFPASVKIVAGKLAAYGEITVDRTKYDIKYGSASFFGSIGDKAIMDEFLLKVSLGAKI